MPYMVCLDTKAIQYIEAHDYHGKQQERSVTLLKVAKEEAKLFHFA